MNGDIQNGFPGTMSKNGKIHLPLDFTAILLNGKKHGYVIVTNLVDSFYTLDGEKIYLNCVLILSCQKFKWIKRQLEKEKRITGEMRKSLMHITICPARRYFLRNNGQIKIHICHRYSADISSNVWFIQKGNMLKIVGRPYIPICRTSDQTSENQSN